jgi:hypothetical protein
VAVARGWSRGWTLVVDCGRANGCVEGERGPVMGLVSSAVVLVLVFGAAGRPWLWAGERERGVIGGGEDLEVREAVGQAHDRLAGGADDPARHAEEHVA